MLKKTNISSKISKLNLKILRNFLLPSVLLSDVFAVAANSRAFGNEDKR